MSTTWNKRERHNLRRYLHERGRHGEQRETLGREEATWGREEETWGREHVRGSLTQNAVYLLPNINCNVTEWNHGVQVFPYFATLTSRMNKLSAG